ncbi:MAG TPA: hypothetical protein VKD90_29765 [Gemmataceae bacterium]|nr:hypothetical protein [Gemmataceae bacterium]
MRTADPFRRAVVLALAWWLIGLGIETNSDAAKDRGRAPRPTAAAEGWRAQASHHEQSVRPERPIPTTSQPAK